MDCIFCKIVNSEIPSYKVYEDKATFAFLDINPISDGHTLVIPKQHFENIHDISEDSAKAVAITVKKVANAVKQTFNADGINILQANGTAAGQAVLHYHTHVVPRMEGDGLPNLHGWASAKPLGNNAKEIAEKIKRNIETK